MTDSINTAAIVAISKAFAAKTATEANKALEVGETEVDVTIRIKGRLIKGEDTLRVATVNIPTLPALALAMKYAGVTGPAAVKAIAQAITASVDLDKDATELLLERDGIKDAVEALKKQLAKTLPKVPRAGVTKAHLDIEVV